MPHNTIDVIALRADLKAEHHRIDSLLTRSRDLVEITDLTDPRRAYLVRASLLMADALQRVGSAIDELNRSRSSDASEDIWQHVVIPGSGPYTLPHEA